MSARSARRGLLAMAAAAAATAAAPPPPSLSVDEGVATVAVDTSSAGAVVLVDTRLAASCARGAACAARVPLHGRAQAAHVYRVDAAAGVALSARLELPPLARGAALRRQPRPPSPLPPVGILYEVWHGFTAAAYANISARGGTPLAVEDVLRAPNGTLSLYDVLDRWGVRSAADRFFYQERPAGGFYCLYRHRAGEAGLVPDCPGISATAARHAAELTSVGVSFVAVDATNLGTPSTEAEVLQVRPAEVLFEEWAALRAAGVPTPAIAGWQRAEAGSTLWQGWLALYNNASYGALVAVAPAGAPGGAAGKKLLFVPSGSDDGVVAQIEANGGRNDVVAVPMWANDHKGAAGEWAFMAPCTTDASSPAAYTTSVVGLGRGASACAQLPALGSPLGSSLSFSPSYQLMYGSVPFSSASKYDGLTFKRQWATLFEAAGAALDGAGAGAGAAAAPALPDNLFVSSYNEWTSQPQPNPYPQPWAVSMGLYGDNESSQLFVDTYGSACARDIEPSDRPGGDLSYSLLGSCLRVAALLYAAVGGGSGAAAAAAVAEGAFAGATPAALRAVWGARAGSAGLSACAVAGEACCSYNETTDGFVPVWSFASRDATDYVASADPAEVDALAANASYAQVCTGFPGQSDFCTAPAVLGGPDAWRGPFILHSGGCGLVSAGVPSGVPVSPGARLPDRLPLFRCPPTAGGGGHYLTSDGTCGGGGAAAAQAQPLGCTHAVRTSGMARPLRACTAAAPVARHYHVTDGVCSDGDADGGVLGYVR